ncbi:MAG TPA: peptidylprolyl isomerase [Candidatus Kapabacteria bacterium]|nr:peptidylprolyl isomerase [Candidatus Kapabacteria bacterium]
MPSKPTILMRLLVASLLLVGVATQKSRAQEPVISDSVVITTSLGKIGLVLYGMDAPKTVENFVKLATKGFYRGILFHRVVPKFVIQAGDPKTKDSTMKADWGTGGESIYGHEFEDELNPNAPSYRRGYVEGTIAMANRGPNTNTSQWFICLGNLSLPKNYTIFGRVTGGMDVVRKIEAVDLDGSTPRVPVKIIDVTVRHLSH